MWYYFLVGVPTVDRKYLMPNPLPWYREELWADALAMSSLLLVVLVANKPAIMAHIIVPLIVVVPSLLLLFLLIHLKIAVSRMLRVGPRSDGERSASSF